MDGDEEQFVVVSGVGEALLQADQVAHAQVTVVRERGVAAVFVRHKVMSDE
jgi:hypothetical protein